MDLPALLSRGRGMTLLRADRVYGADHLRHAARLAERAIDQGRARSADRATEALLYAAGERQVHKAIALVGLTPEIQAIAAISWDAAALDAIATREGWTRDDALLAGDEGVLDAFGVTREERAMISRERWGDLVLEKVALLDVAKP